MSNKYHLAYTGPIPDGWEPTGEIRKPKRGEYILSQDEDLVTAVKAKVLDSIAIILQRKQWHPSESKSYWSLKISSKDGTLIPRAVVWSWDYLSSQEWFESGNAFRTFHEAQNMAEKCNSLIKSSRKQEK